MSHQLRSRLNAQNSSTIITEAQLKPLNRLIENRWPRDSTHKMHNNVIVLRNDPDCSIVEILSTKCSDKDNDPTRFIEALCIHVEPKACNRIVKQLSSTFPLEACLSHLKRVRRRPSPSKVEKDSKDNQKTCIPEAKINSESNPIVVDPKTYNNLNRPKKRLKPDVILEILISTRTEFHSTHESSTKYHNIIAEFGPLHSIVVPKYEPQSEQEWKEMNALWPCLYHPLRFKEYKIQQSALSEIELNRIQELMKKCILTESVLIVDPNYCDSSNFDANDSGVNGNADNENTTDPSIVSTSRIEHDLQHRLSQRQQQQQQQQQQHDGPSTSLLDNNPLATPILFALQGVSRVERETKSIIDKGMPVDSSSTGSYSSKLCQNQQQQDQSQPKRRQYICTGYGKESILMLSNDPN